MTLRSRSALLTKANEDLPDNTTELISPEDVRTLIKDLADSNVNKKGDTGILGILRYSATHSITDGKDIIYRDYLDDALAAFSWADLTGSPSDNTDLIDLLDTDYLRRDGLYPWTGDHDADGNSLLGLSSFVLKGASIDRFIASLSVGEDVEFNTINAAFYFKRTGVDKFVIDSDMKVYLEFFAGIAGDMGISLGPGDLSDRWRMFVSDGLGAYNADESYSYHNNTSHHILTGLSGSKGYHFLANGDLDIDSGNVIVSDITKAFYIADGSIATNGSWRQRVVAGEYVTEKLVAGVWEVKQTIS